MPEDNYLGHGLGQNDKSGDASFERGDQKTAPMVLHAITTADVEDGQVREGAELEEREVLRQGLHQRHIQMIALAGAIGTGLFLNSGRAIAHAGPLGALLAYILMGVIVADVILVIGEMGALIPLSGGVIRYMEYFVSPSLSFANGWNLVYSYCVSIPAEIVAAAVLVQFWNESINSAVFITIFSVIIMCTSLLYVRVYGELEFVFAMLKIVLVVIINIMALVITCGGGPDHEAIGFRYWKTPGPFVQYAGISGSLGQFLGFWVMLNNALYAYSGAEVITVAAAETKNPKRNIPKAARRIFARIFFFYILTVFMTTLVVSSDDPLLVKSGGTANRSPFVIAARRAHIAVMPHIINSIIITSAFSSAGSNMLSGPRVLYGMARHGHAPKVFLRISRFGVPWVAISFIGAFMALGYMSVSSGANTVFGWLQDLVAVSTAVNYILILCTYIRFYHGCRVQGISRKELPWAAPFQPWSSYISLGLLILLYFTGAFSVFMKGKWSTESFVSNYLNLPVVLLLFMGHLWWSKNKILKLEQLPIRHFIELANARPEPLPKPKKGLHKLNFLWG